MSFKLPRNQVQIARIGILIVAVVLSLLTLRMLVNPTSGNDVKADTAVFPGATWAAKTPTEVNLDSTKINQFATNVGGTGVIIKDGYLVKTWGTANSKAEWASASKPLWMTMLMFAMKEGKIPDTNYLIKDLGWPLTVADQNMTFSHLMNMVSGYARAEGPGEAWAYNDYGVKLYVRSIFDKLYGVNSDDTTAVTNHITAPSRLGPLQFQDGTLITQKSGPRVNMSPRDFARIGWLWLNKGNWNGTQLLPSSYFDTYTKPQVPGTLPRTTVADTDYLGIGTAGGDSDQFAYGPGIYGNTWWFNAPVGTGTNLTWPDAPADTYQANGHWGLEVMTMIPSLNMVIAARGNWGTFEPGNAASSMNQNLKLLKDAVMAPPVPACGNNILETGEICDDGNTANGDQCSSTCQNSCTTPTIWDGAACATPVQQDTPLLDENFDRADNVVVGNGWTESETTGAITSISSNKLYFADTSDIALKPMVVKSFTAPTKGTVKWSFDFNWVRTGTEKTYDLYMQLGDGALMTNANKDTGVAVNIRWGNFGTTSNQILSTRKAGVNTQVQTLSGANTLLITADLLAKTYSISVNGTIVKSNITFDSNVALSAVRFFTDGLNDTEFSQRTFDNVKIINTTFTTSTTPPPPPPTAICGNNLLETGETCDDGNTANGDQCSSNCLNACTIPNTWNGATCIAPPPAPVCGNNILESGEVCDDGNTVNGDQCSSTCQNKCTAPQVWGGSLCQTIVQFPIIGNLVVNDSANASKWSIKTNLQVNNTHYGDRTFTLKTIPSQMLGAGWIQTANASKTSTNNPLATFQVGWNSTVYVAIDDRITTKPSWITSGGWVNSGLKIVNSEPNTFSLYSKVFADGSTVALGPIADSTKGMYIVIVKAN